MSAQTIYLALVASGMTPASACGMLGNMKAESVMHSNNLQDSYNTLFRLTDEEYTRRADAGEPTYNGKAFEVDSAGYGLCQWTYWSRKRDLLSYCWSKGVSVGNEEAQVEFCIIELQRDFRELWSWLCTNNGVYEAAKRICEEYERPAANNIEYRAQKANEFYMSLAGSELAGYKPTPTPPASVVPEVPTVEPVPNSGTSTTWIAPEILQTWLNLNNIKVGKVDGQLGALALAGARELVKRLGG